MANEKITELTELTTPNKADLVAVVDDVAGSPVTKKATLNNALGTPVDYRDFDELATAPDTPASGDLRVYALNDSKLYAKDDAGNVAAIGEGVLPHLICARLTPTTSIPVELDEQSATDEIFWTPFSGNAVRLYDGAAWKFLVLTEDSFKLTDTQTGDTTNGNAIITDLTDTSMFVVGMEVTGTGIGVDAVIDSIDSATQVTLDVNSTADGNDISLTFKAPAGTKYDMFGTISSGAAVLRRPVVSATLTEQDGVKVLDGETTALYLGYVQTGATAGQLDYSIATETIFNFYNNEPLGYGWYKPAWIPASALHPSDSGGCGALQELDGSLVLPFDASTDEQASINLVFPPGWSGKLKAIARWKVNNADAGNVIWAIKTENAAAGEVMGNVATTAFSASAAAGTQYKFSQTALLSEHTAGADGENIDLYILRDADNGSDTYASDAYLYGVMVYYLMNEEV